MVLGWGSQPFKSYEQICHIEGVGTTPQDKNNNSYEPPMSQGIKKYMVLEWGSQQFKSY